MPELNLIQSLAVFILPLVFAITIHEAAHGYVAWLLGDNTARVQGRVTLNPIPHIDPVGTLLLPLGLYALSSLAGGGGMMFGWAKPVPINPRNLGNPRRDMALIAVAGPASNLVQLLLWGLALRLASGMESFSPWMAEPMAYMALGGVLINGILLVLNLLPLLPLDGGRIVASLLPYHLAQPYSRLEPWGFFILIALLFTGLLGPILEPALHFVQSLAFTLAGL